MGSNLEPALDKLVQDHNVLSNFTQDVMEYCDARGIPWGVECAPARDQVGLDTHWTAHETWGTFWHHHRVRALERRGAKRYIVARC